MWFPEEARGFPVSLDLLAPLGRKVSGVVLDPRGRKGNREREDLPASGARWGPGVRRVKPVLVDRRDHEAEMGKMEFVQPIVLRGQGGPRVLAVLRGLLVLRAPPAGLSEFLEFGSRLMRRPFADGVNV